eukprot:scaffold206355_cov50-Prasinocladus_malaysianus.AAC.3
MTAATSDLPACLGMQQQHNMTANFHITAHEINAQAGCRAVTMKHLQYYLICKYKLLRYLCNALQQGLLMPVEATNTSIYCLIRYTWHQFAQPAAYPKLLDAYNLIIIACKLHVDGMVQRFQQQSLSVGKGRGQDRAKAPNNLALACNASSHQLPLEASGG